jgi:hypothetical protein
MPDGERPTEAQIDEQERVSQVLEEAASALGDRFGGAWIDRFSGLPSVGVAAVGVTQDDVDALMVIGNAARCDVTVVPVRYTWEELLRFYEQLGVDPMSDSVHSYGIDTRVNAVTVGCHRVDHDAMERLRALIPADAIRFELSNRREFTTSL